MDGLLAPGYGRARSAHRRASPLASGDEAEPPPVSLCARSVDGEAGAGGNSAPDGEGPRATYGVEVGGGADAHGPGRVAAGLLGNGGGPTDLPIRASAATERAAAAVRRCAAVVTVWARRSRRAAALVRDTAPAAGVGRRAGPAVERVPAVAIRDRPTVRARPVQVVGVQHVPNKARPWVTVGFMQ